MREFLSGSPTATITIKVCGGTQPLYSQWGINRLTEGEHSYNRDHSFFSLPEREFLLTAITTPHPSFSNITIN